MSARIGVDNLVYAPMTAEGDATTWPTYGSVKAATGVISINVAPSVSQETLYYDDGPGDSATSLGDITMTINKDMLTTEQRTDLLGQITDEKGVQIAAAGDSPPYVAVGYRTKMTNGKYKYYWYYKVKFGLPETNADTQGDTVNFQTDAIEGRAVKVNTTVKVKVSSGDTTGTPKKPWKATIVDGDTEADATVIQNWFKSVYQLSSL